MPRPVATQGTLSDLLGMTGRLVGPPAIPTTITPTVIAEGRPVLTVGAPVKSHGNPYNPKAPGFNPPCAYSAVAGLFVPNVIVEGKPLAVYGPPKIGSFLACGHVLFTPGAVTVLAGV